MQSATNLFCLKFGHQFVTRLDLDHEKDERRVYAPQQPLEAPAINVFQLLPCTILKLDSLSRSIPQVWKLDAECTCLNRIETAVYAGNHMVGAAGSSVIRHQSSFLEHFFVVAYERAAIAQCSKVFCLDKTRSSQTYRRSLLFCPQWLRRELERSLLPRAQPRSFATFMMSVMSAAWP